MEATLLSDRRAKIVATIGPATQSRENLERAIRSGMSVARLNFSHGKHEDHKKVIENIRSLALQLKANVTILQDLQGPKIRVGEFENGGIQLEAGEIVTVTTDKVLGKKGVIPTDFLEIVQSCKVGTKVLLDDGLLEIQVTEISDSQNMKAQVNFGGFLKNRKGMNIPGAFLPIDSMTEKDHRDLEFGLLENVDYVALSFVRRAQDILDLREKIQGRGKTTKIIAKIEMLEAIEHLEEIVRVSDAVMVARGDLAIEVGQSRLPGLQKRIIKTCNRLGKPVITATQMLDSMVENPRPTRAEITDIANAVLDGTDALMLSAETASGKYPFSCIQTMHEIIMEVEKNYDKYYKISLEDEFLSIPASIGASACLSAQKLNARAIVCLTTSGKTAQIIAGFRPKAKIVSVTKEIDVLNGLELIWGMQTLAIEPYSSLSEIIDRIEKVLVETGIAKNEDRIIVTYGHPVSAGAKTNSVHVHVIHNSLYKKRPESELPLRLQKTKLS